MFYQQKHNSSFFFSIKTLIHLPSIYFIFICSLFMTITLTVSLTFINNCVHKVQVLISCEYFLAIHLHNRSFCECNNTTCTMYRHDIVHVYYLLYMY